MRDTYYLWRSYNCCKVINTSKQTTRSIKQNAIEINQSFKRIEKMISYICDK